MNYAVEIIGWAIIHSLWQFVILGSLTFATLRSMARASANARYLVACLAMLTVTAVTLGTIICLVSQGGLTNGPHESNSSVKPVQTAERPLSTLEAALDEESLTDSAESSNALSTSYWLEIARSISVTTVLPFMVVAWFLGVIYKSVHSFGEFRYMRLLRSSAFSVGGGWESRINELCAELGITRPVVLKRSLDSLGAFTVGWLKPVIFIPAAALSNLNPAEIEAICKHELAHIKRYDYLINVIQSIFETAFFYHPVTWWISAAIRREREFACDALAAEWCSSRIGYARALMNLEQLRHDVDKKALTVRLAAGSINLVERINLVIRPCTSFRPSRARAIIGFLPILIAGFLLINLLMPSIRPAIAFVDGTSGTKSIAIGFVGLPPIDRSGDPAHGRGATASLLIEKLKLHRAPAIGFVRGASISGSDKDSISSANIIRQWRDAGLEVGIGNFKHVSLFDVSLDEFKTGVARTERATKQILDETGANLRFFSYPYLNTGRTIEDRDLFENWLKERGLRAVHYTIDNNEWVYSYAYDMAAARGDRDKMKAISSEYLEYMSRIFDHFEACSQDLFGRDISQTLVLTSSRLVAENADELLTMIEKRGYRFVSMDEAMADKAYRSTDDSDLGSSGNSWLYRWAASQGKTHREEPQVDADVWQEWLRSRPRK